MCFVPTWVTAKDPAVHVRPVLPAMVLCARQSTHVPQTTGAVFHLQSASRLEPPASAVHVRRERTRLRDLEAQLVSRPRQARMWIPQVPRRQLAVQPGHTSRSQASARASRLTPATLWEEPMPRQSHHVRRALSPARREAHRALWPLQAAMQVWQIPRQPRSVPWGHFRQVLEAFHVHRPRQARMLIRQVPRPQHSVLPETMPARKVSRPVSRPRQAAMSPQAVQHHLHSVLLEHMLILQASSHALLPRQDHLQQVRAQRLQPSVQPVHSHLVLEAFHVPRLRQAAMWMPQVPLLQHFARQALSPARRGAHRALWPLQALMWGRPARQRPPSVLQEHTAQLPEQLPPCRVLQMISVE